MADAPEDYQLQSGHRRFMIRSIRRISFIKTNEYCGHVIDRSVLGLCGAPPKWTEFEGFCVLQRTYGVELFTYADFKEN